MRRREKRGGAKDGQRSKTPDATAGAWFAQAMACHQAGRMAEAAGLYRRLLCVVPIDADAWHLLGLTDYAGQRFPQAARFISRAIAIAPQSALFHANLGPTLRSLVCHLASPGLW